MKPSRSTEHELSFRPFPLLGNPHVQTILATCLKLPGGAPSQRIRVELEDGDALAVEVTEPPSENASVNVVMIHGLCGCHESNYLIRMAKKVSRIGGRSLRVNLRGCGSGIAWAKGVYHSGRSEDVRAVVEHTRKEWPNTPLVLIGFSLSGNIVLKLAGELGDAAEGLIDSLIAISPPADLEASARKLHRAGRRLYERHFVKLLRQAADSRYARFPDLQRKTLPAGDISIVEFDEHYTSRSAGFDGALDYYARCSSAPLAQRIAIPTTVLFADDDPMVDADALSHAELPACVRVLKTKRGGHLGFLGIPGFGGFRWLDRQLLSWIAETTT